MPPAGHDRDGRLLQRHITCVGCGYDLFQQPLDGRCPECELSVQRSRVRLPLDSDLAWQAQIERGLRLAIITSAGWAVCYLAAILAWIVPPTGAILFLVALATLIVEFRSRQLLWETPSGCELLISPKATRFARFFEVLTGVGLLFLGAGATTGSVNHGRLGYVLVTIGCLFLCVGVLHVPGLYSLFITIAHDIGSARLPRELRYAMIPRLTIEPLLFGSLAVGLVGSVAFDLRWSDGLVTLIWLSVIGFGIAQPFFIGSQYELWQRVREVRQLEEDEERGESA